MTDDNETNETVKTYRITVTRQIAQSCSLEIEAEDEDEAREKAEDELFNLPDDNWDDGWTTQDPEIVDVTELSDEPPDEDEAA